MFVPRDSFEVLDAKLAELRSTLGCAFKVKITALEDVPPWRAKMWDRSLSSELEELGPAALNASGTQRSAKAVLSALGARTLGPDGVLERAMRLIAQAIEATRSSRIVALGAAGSIECSLAEQNRLFVWLVQKLVVESFLKNPMGFATRSGRYCCFRS